MKFLRQRNEVYLVSSLMLLGLLLRLPSLRLGMWRDEASTYFDALPSGLGEVVRTVIGTELSPPGFYLLMHQLMCWFGAQEIVLKLPALFFGLLLIPATYGLSWVIGSRLTGLVGAAIATLAPKAIYYSQESRPYSLTALLCCLVVLLYCKALKSDHQRWYLLGFVLCTSLLVYVQYTGLLLLGSLVVVTVYLLWCQEPGVRVVPFALAFGSVFLLFAPWLPIFLIHLHTGTPWWNKPPFWMWPKLFIANLAYTIPLTHFLQILLILPILLTLGVGARRLFYRARLSSRLGIAPVRAPIATLGISLGLLAGIQAALGYGVPGTGRYMFAFAPLAWVIYSSWVLALFHYFNRYWDRYLTLKGLRVAIVSVILCGLVLPNVIEALSFGNSPKSGLRALAADVGRWHLEQTVYVLAPDYLGITFGYYFARIHPVPFYGFPRWEHPELFNAQDYTHLKKTSAAAVIDTEQRIQNEAESGYRKLVFIKPMESQDKSEIPQGESLDDRIDQLLSKLKQTYRLLLEVNYPAKDEAVSLYLFELIHR